MKKLWLILIFQWACTPVYQSSVNSESNPKTLRYQDFAYESQIKTIQLYPKGSARLHPVVIRLGERNLRLEFDDLRDHHENYYARIIHCSYDWTKSDLSDLDFMEEYNEFPLSNFEFSIDTQIPYVHYWLDIPGVKIPGNYIVMVYRDSDKSDLILTKRFMVFDNRVIFSNEQNLVGSGSVAAINQQLNFTINYKNLNVVNPMEDIHVVIRQNQRWDNLASNVKPSFIHEMEKELEYRVFDDAKMFKGGNEFRFFDLRSISYPGRNVQSVNRQVKPPEAYIATDKSRSNDVFAQYEDLNGGYFIENLDYRDLSFTNYLNVNFALAAPQPVKGDVYVTGAFNYWNLLPTNKMTYDSTKGAYTSNVLLKQGWYDYQYVVKSPDLPYYHFEGSHFQTENEYEIFVYFRPFQPRADLLIGYLRFYENPR